MNYLSGLNWGESTRSARLFNACKYFMDKKVKVNILTSRNKKYQNVLITACTNTNITIYNPVTLESNIIEYNNIRDFVIYNNIRDSKNNKINDLDQLTPELFNVIKSNKRITIYAEIKTIGVRGDARNTPIRYTDCEIKNIEEDKITFSCNNEPLVTNTNTYHSIIWVSIENEYNDLTGGKKVNKRQRKTRKHQKSRKHKKSRKSRK
uniref:Uncharacterized protein n=1 Tax=viral metagenome TaxID=1070528 RepID=A0A6C0CWD7_9ZZZZ